MLRRGEREQLREIVGGLALVTQVGLLMVGSILAGLFLGLWVADFPGGVVGIVVGVAAGFYSCYRMLVRPDFGRRSGGKGGPSTGAESDDKP